MAGIFATQLEPFEEVRLFLSPSAHMKQPSPLACSERPCACPYLPWPARPPAAVPPPTRHPCITCSLSCSSFD